MNKSLLRALTDYIPLALFFIAILVSGIITRQEIIRTLPCLVTLVVTLLSSRANRYTFILGACNCALYAAGYIMSGLYGSAANALLVSMPLQISSFFLWKRKAYGKSTVLKTLNGRNRLLLTAALTVCWGAAYLVFVNIKNASDLILLDSVAFVVGFAVTLLTTFAFVECVYLGILNQALALTTWIIMTVRDVSMITFVLVNFYNTYRTLMAVSVWTKLYREQLRVSAAGGSKGERNDEQVENQSCASGDGLSGTEG